MAGFWGADRWLGQGDHARDLGDWREAARCYERYLKAYPKDAGIWVQLGHASKEAGMRDRALAAYEKAIEASEDSAEVQRHRAFLLRDMGLAEDAARAFLDLWAEADCRVEAVGLGAAAPLRARLMAAAAREPRPVWLEVGDLVKYHIDHPNPSGIQRVIAECVLRLLDLRSDVALVLIGTGGVAQKVSEDAFRRLIALSRSGAADDIQASALRLFQEAPPIRPNPGSVVLTLGAFWADPHFVDGLADLKAAGVTIVSMVHDLIPLTHPSFAAPGVAAQMGPAFTRLSAIADRLVAVSDQTYAAMIALGGREAHCLVVRLCHDLTAGPDAPGRLDAALGDEAFVLSVGTIEPRKNHALLLRLWRRYRDEGLSPPRLVLAGRTGWGVDDLMAEFARTNDADGSILRLGAVSEGELARLYRDCMLTVFPSFVEGWGLPAGESLVSGKICVASQAVADVSEALLLFDPEDLNDLRRVLDPLLFEPGALEEAAAQMRASFTARGWDQVAGELSALLDDLRVD